MTPKFRPSTFLFMFIALTSVTAQTFQYSRGWKTGKRDGHIKLESNVKEIENTLQKTFTPCQLEKLKFALGGKHLNERLLKFIWEQPCDVDDETDPQQKYYKNENQEPPLESFL